MTEIETLYELIYAVRRDHIKLQAQVSEIAFNMKDTRYEILYEFIEFMKEQAPTYRVRDLNSDRMINEFIKQL